MPNATDTGTLSYAQLKAVWLQASKGTRYHSNAWASLMAAIAEAESGGQVLVTNPNDNNGTQTSWGLWQISNGTHSAPGPDWGDPVGNAKLAIGKLDDQGLSAWGTYDSGAYKRYLSDKSAPDYTLTANPSAAEQAQATSEATSTAECAWSVRWGGIVFGIGSGQVCLLSKVQVRVLVGVGLLGAGILTAQMGLGWIIKAATGAEVASKLGPALAALGPEGAAAGVAVEASAPKPKPPKPPKPAPATTQSQMATAS